MRSILLRTLPIAAALLLVAAPLLAAAGLEIHPPPHRSVAAGSSTSSWISVRTDSSCSGFDVTFTKTSGPSWTSVTDLGLWGQVDAAPPAWTAAGGYTSTFYVFGSSTCGTTSKTVTWNVEVY